MSPPNSAVNSPPSSVALVLGFWLLVGLPLDWGVYHTLRLAVQLFQ
jgi:hypothetical protein